ncbi:hypothetical protein TL16_g11045 [Triparma laevis f. inornata]|uniref:MYND-type domain-containing protein n=1 Tax=Triparma laevis f. inornata TaxID=1714386 RepID=A0A9W7BCF9_9STRA|nr:hypothetical protein TL16_g11045 [Triparma laevis f. inornata]
MKSSKSPSEPAAAAKPVPCCGFPGCPKPAPHQCSRCRGIHYCSAEHQKAHWKQHKKLCIAPQKKTSAPIPPPPPSSKAPPRTCGFPSCTKKGQRRSSKCGEIDYCSEKHQEAHWKYHKKICVALSDLPSSSTGTRRLFFEVFDVLEIVGGEGIYFTVRESLEQQVLRITRSEDLVKLRALGKLCSRDFFNDSSLLVVAGRRILEVLELAIPEEKKKNGECEKAIKVYERYLAGQMKVLGEDHKDTLFTLNNLGIVYDELKDYEKALEYYERALKGFERLMGKTHPDTLSAAMNIARVFYILKDYAKAKELYERALEGKEAQLGKDHESSRRSAKNLKRCFVASDNNVERLEELLVAYPWLSNT